MTTEIKCPHCNCVLPEEVLLEFVMKYPLHPDQDAEVRARFGNDDHLWEYCSESRIPPHKDSEASTLSKEYEELHGAVGDEKYKAAQRQMNAVFNDLMDSVVTSGTGIQSIEHGPDGVVVKNITYDELFSDISIHDPKELKNES